MRPHCVTYVVLLNCVSLCTLYHYVSSDVRKLCAICISFRIIIRSILIFISWRSSSFPFLAVPLSLSQHNLPMCFHYFISSTDLVAIGTQSEPALVL